jgi:hypothetical protein
MYALNLAEDGRILSATRPEYASQDNAIVDMLPEGDISNYRYVDGEYIYDPIPVESEEETPSQLDVIEAQVAYTAMMTGTLLEV